MDQLQNTDACNVYLENLDKTIDEKEICGIFFAFGNILNCKIARDENGISKGFGFVHFENEEAARNSIEKLNGIKINQNKIYVGPFTENDNETTEIIDNNADVSNSSPNMTNQSLNQSPDSSIRRFAVGNVFIKNLDKTMDEKTLYDIFFSFGMISSVKIARDENGNSKGYGFVHFESEDAANLSIHKLNGMVLRSKRVYVGHFIPREIRERELGTKYTNIYVKNFGEDMSDDEFFKMFQPFGMITSFKLFKNDEGKSKGFGFVAYDNSDAAEAAVNTMNGTKFNGGKPLYVGRAKKKAERQRELKNKFDNDHCDPPAYDPHLKTMNN